MPADGRHRRPEVGRRQLRSYPERCHSSNDNTVKRNTTSGNGGEGIVLSSSSDNTLKRNMASGNDDDGMILFDGTGNVLKKNAVHENGSHGIVSNETDLILVANKANRNGFFNGAEDGAGLGINVPAGTTNAKNKAKRNDDPRQCMEADVKCHVAP